MFNVVGPVLDTVWGAIKPYREAIFGLSLAVGGGWAAFFRGYRSQSRRPEEALSQAASASPFAPRPVKLTPKDRQLVNQARETLSDLTEAVVELTRATRTLTREMRGSHPHAEET